MPGFNLLLHSTFQVLGHHLDSWFTEYQFFPSSKNMIFVSFAFAIIRKEWQNLDNSRCITLPFDSNPPIIIQLAMLLFIVLERLKSSSSQTSILSCNIRLTLKWVLNFPHDLWTHLKRKKITSNTLHIHVRRLKSESLICKILIWIKASTYNWWQWCSW